VRIGDIRVVQGDCVEVMQRLPDNTFHAIVTDPPYGLSFMGKAWDNLGHGNAQQAWHRRWLDEALRVLKPGGHLVAFGGSRTFHRLFSAAEDAGFEIRDCLMWIYGSGFPKSMNLGKTLEAWNGWGTALKPAHEPVLLARKPLIGTVAANVLEHGTGGLNIDASRIAAPGEEIKTHSRSPEASAKENRPVYGEYGPQETHQTEGQQLGRWPANVMLQHLEGCRCDGVKRVGAGEGSFVGEGGEVCEAHEGYTRPNSSSYTHKQPGHRKTFGEEAVANWVCEPGCPVDQLDTMSNEASRFFYCAKAAKKEKNAGLEHVEPQKQDASREEGRPGGENPRNRGASKRANFHPTVKPVAVMDWLLGMVVPNDGIVLDPFAGSGTTLVAAVQRGVGAVGIEQNPDYLPLIEGRVRHAQENP